MISCVSASSSSSCSIVARRCSAFRQVIAPSSLAHNTPYFCHRTSRLLSSSSLPQQSGLTPEGEVFVAGKGPSAVPHHEVVRFPSSSPKQPIVVTNDPSDKESVPVLLNSKEHAVGYLSKILNARVYDAAIETELQEAKNLSTVRHLYLSVGCFAVL
jgi:hypothetical protein